MLDGAFTIAILDSWLQSWGEGYCPQCPRLATPMHSSLHLLPPPFARLSHCPQFVSGLNVQARGETSVIAQQQAFAKQWLEKHTTHSVMRTASAAASDILMYKLSEQQATQHGLEVTVRQSHATCYEH